MKNLSPPLSRARPNSAEMSILKRDIDFGIGDAPAPRWCDDNEVRTAFFDAFSLFLPEGERFFIRSVHAYLDIITDDRLRDDVKAFSAQEAYHTREHETYNRALRDEGLPLEEIYQRVGKLLGKVKSKLERLSITVGLEHLTACLGYITLKYPEILSRSDPRYRDLWTWHSLEEIEHKAVAFEVFRIASSKLPKWKAYLLRCGALLLATKHIAGMQFDFMIEILKIRGHKDTWRTRAAVLWVMLGAPGYYRRIFWYYLRFMRPNFFPTHGTELSHAQPWQDYFNQRAFGSQDNHA